MAAELLPVVAEPRAIDRGATLATAEVIARTIQIREVMEKVMKTGVHYGVIPGTQKPTMYQPGADVLAVTFRIAPHMQAIEDLSTSDDVRYRVTVRGVHQLSGETLAEGVGSCWSNEEKYRWRKPVCDEEYQETRDDHRREKWAKGQNGKPYKQKQIRTSPADVDNTVLKMAVKRAKIAMILNATGASDVFAQDLEDLSDELRESLAGDEPAAPAPPVQQPQRKSATPPPAPPVPPPPPVEEPEAGDVLVTHCERRTNDEGRVFWVIRTNDGKVYLRPEEGEGWAEILAALRHAQAHQKRVVLVGAAVVGQKVPNVVEARIVGGAA